MCQADSWRSHCSYPLPIFQSCHEGKINRKRGLLHHINRKRESIASMKNVFEWN